MRRITSDTGPVTPPLNVEIRRATLADVDNIAAAHLDSIHSIGAQYYDAETVKDWGVRLIGELYAKAMAQGEVFFIAVGDLVGTQQVLGFSSHRIDDGEYRTAVYVRGGAARRGVGSALFRAAESSAMAAGATSIHVAASLAAVEFYVANGFEEMARGAHQLSTGRRMACVFMRKRVTQAGC